MIAKLALLFTLAAPISGEGVSYFQGSFEETLAKAKAEKKPVLIDFFTDWCVYCKKMDKTTLQDASVISYLNGIVTWKIDAEKGEARKSQRNTE